MKAADSIRAFLFDVGWTLIYPNPTRKEANEKYLLDLGYSIPPQVFESAHSAVANYYRANRWQTEAMKNIVQFWRGYYTTYTQHLGIDETGLSQALYDHANETVQFHIYPETVPVLQELRRRGYLIGAVSNWSTELRGILSDLQLMDYLDALVVSDEIGFYKPQPEIFRCTLDSLGVSASAAVHIGDDLEADVEGARQAGIRPIWLDRDGTGDSHPSARIQSLDELLSVRLIGE